MGTIRFVRLPGTSGDYASTPDNAAFSAPSNLTLIALIAADDYTPSAGQNIASHRTTTGNQRAWQWTLGATGTLNLSLSLDGSAQTAHTSTDTVDFTDGTVHWVMVTRNATTGDVKHYTADYVPGSAEPPAIGSFTQLGDTINNGITGALHNSTSVLEVGSTQVGTANLFDGDNYRFLFYTGIYGSGSESLVRDFNPNDAANNGVTSWTAVSTGETWTLNGGDPTLLAIHSEEADLSGTGTLAAAAKLIVTGDVGLAGSGTLTVDGERIALGAIGLAGSGTLEADPELEVHGAIGLSGVGTLAAAGIRTAFGVVDLSGTGTLEADPQLEATAAVALDGTGTLTAAGTSTTAQPTEEPSPGGFTPSRETLAAWDDEAIRLQIIRDEDDLLLLI